LLLPRIQPGIVGRRALPAGCLACLGATPAFPHGLRAVAGKDRSTRDRSNDVPCGGERTSCAKAPRAPPVRQRRARITRLRFSLTRSIPPFDTELCRAVRTP